MSTSIMSLATAAYRTAVKSTGSQEIAQLVCKTRGFNIDFSETEQEFVYRERRAMAREIFAQMKIFNDAFQNAMDHEFFKHCITLPCEIKTASTGYTSGCISLELTHKEFEHIKLSVDLGYQLTHDSPQYFDMDVNMLVSALDVDDPGFMTTLQRLDPLELGLQESVLHSSQGTSEGLASKGARQGEEAVSRSFQRQKVSEAFSM
ncbi:hypothetical protein ma67 [Moumouvirus australiensis]|uniref:Uncharacterized protein n=1 Tax=Moumouvirus australiensis TaxID=2109587 RepID=A0A2P1EKP1_9VIRU|nr:hypothetical protein QKC55_gp836 [Moumouvirus australiensis]AVL94454.1 hypothetical protein ma67 [Moumouvirus australiensis]